MMIKMALNLSMAVGGSMWLTLSIYSFGKIATEFANFKLSSEEQLNIAMSTEELNFCLTVLAITMSIMLYSKLYFLSPSDHTKDYFFTLNLFFFMGSMIILIASNSVMVVMLGWDGLGITSFLLITYYNNLLATSSALATFLLNRLGDMFMIFVVVWALSCNSPSHFSHSTTLINSSNYYSKMFLLFFTMGCMTKSAQLPFSSWLPAAMAAPTPVSSLVHSSTLVTAGIFLLAKINNMFISFNEFIHIGMSSAILLSLLAGSFACLEKDVKKLVAMSTLSQLGILAFMLMAANTKFTMFHIYSHAFFKSLLFMMIGILILICSGNQDGRKISFKKSNNYMMAIAISMSLVNLIGFPFTSGFFSKDFILTEEYVMGTNLIVKYLLLMACCMSVIYCGKLFVWVFMKVEKSEHSQLLFTKEMGNLSTVMPLGMSVLMGGIYAIFWMDKDIYKSSYTEKLSGVFILVVGAIFLLMNSQLFGLKPLLPLLENMLNLKFIMVSFFSKMSLNISSICAVEATLWGSLVSLSTDQGPKLALNALKMGAMITACLSMVVIFFFWNM